MYYRCYYKTTFFRRNLRPVHLPGPHTRASGGAVHPGIGAARRVHAVETGKCGARVGAVHPGQRWSTEADVEYIAYR